MATRYYSSVAAETTLVASITNGNTSIQIASATGLPALTPFTLALDYEAATEELVEVTAVAGTTLTVTRGIDGTSAAAHNAGARVRHVSSARDFSDSRTHESTATNVHGTAVGSAVVGTNDTQTLSNKTLNNASGTLSNIDIFADTPTWVTTVNADIAGTADIMKWLRDSSEPHEVAKITNNGALMLRNQNAAADSVHNTYRIRVTFDNGTTDTFRVLSGGQVDIFGKDPAASVLDVQAAASQSGDIMRVQNSSSATLMAIQSNGRTLANVGATVAQPGVTSGAVLQVGGSNVGYTGNLTQWVSPGNAIVARVDETGLIDANGGLSITGGTVTFPLESPAGSITAATGFSIVTSNVKIVGDQVHALVVFERTGANITGGVGGSIGDIDAFTLPAAMRPNATYGGQSLPFSVTDGFGFGAGRLTPTTGVFELVAWAEGGVIQSTRNIRVFMVYPAP